MLLNNPHEILLTEDCPRSRKRKFEPENQSIIGQFSAEEIEYPIYPPDNYKIKVEAENSELTMKENENIEFPVSK